MSYGVMPFAVEWEPLQELFGSQDEVVLAKFLREMPGELDSLDQEEEPEFRERLPARVALRQLIMGEPLDPELGRIYAYLIEALCFAYDTPLANSRWYPTGSRWLTGPFDTTLREAGVPPSAFSVGSHVLDRGSPFPIPKPRDFPYMGYLTPAEADSVATLLDPIDPERFRLIGGQEHFLALRGWMRKCRDTDRGFLSFYH